jgi:hypothetical protein
LYFLLSFTFSGIWTQCAFFYVHQLKTFAHIQELLHSVLLPIHDVNEDDKRHSHMLYIDGTSFLSAFSVGSCVRMKASHILYLGMLSSVILSCRCTELHWMKFPTVLT